MKQEPSCEETSPLIQPGFASLTSTFWPFPEGAFLYATCQRKEVQQVYISFEYKHR